MAALCILTVRGAIMNACFYAHFKLRALAATSAGTTAAAAASTTGLAGLRYVLTLPFHDVKCGLLVAYFAVFGTVIAIMKDVPDFEGDIKVSACYFNFMYIRNYIKTYCKCSNCISTTHAAAYRRPQVA
jgi:hypothetical protein